ncbi:MAG: hypothetical protein IPL78_29470 [Chloroflexi bacterium]|nr:hypothetical protein [Chloroflexota bacterium]
MLLAEIRRYGWFLYAERAKTFLSLALHGAVMPVMMLILRDLSPQAYTSPTSLSTIILTFCLWYWCMRITTETIEGLADDVNTGSLATLWVVSPSMTWLMLIRAVVVAFYLLPETGIMFLVLSFVLQAPVVVMPVMGIILLTVVGTLGFTMFALGLFMRFKAIEGILGLLQYLILLFAHVFAPSVTSSPLIRFIPIGWGVHLIQQKLLVGQVSWTDVFGLIIQSVVLLVVGSFIWRQMVTNVMRNGAFGHY